MPVLATGYVQIHDNSGKTILVRALFDSGSEMNVISEACLNQLKLKKHKMSFQINGITGSELFETNIVNVKLTPWFKSSEKYELSKSFIVLKKIPFSQRAKLKEETASEFSKLQKADPEFERASKADIILGIDIWSEILLEGIVKSKNGLCAQNTKLGYVIFGAIEQKSDLQMNIAVTNVAISEPEEDDLNKLLRRFWEQENVSDNFEPEEDKYAEETFKKNVTRASNGRYIVRLPLTEESELGDSKAVARQRLLQLERRLKKDGELRKNYNEFMSEYVSRNHMRLATKEEREAANGYYIPHHAVTKRFRVVFDGSCATSNGKSVNDIQLTGPNLQDHLSDIIMRFRFHKYVLSADIKKNVSPNLNS